jgi:5-methylcytosine-specific restriction endonuclease McrA
VTSCPKCGSSDVHAGRVGNRSYWEDQLLCESCGHQEVLTSSAPPEVITPSRQVRQGADLGKFVALLDAVPRGLDRSTGKDRISPEVKDAVKQRDSSSCQVCQWQGSYGYPRKGVRGLLAIHRIVPNGPSTEENLITLCKHCHRATRLLLYTSGKWRWTP